MSGLARYMEFQSNLAGGGEEEQGEDDSVQKLSDLKDDLGSSAEVDRVFKKAIREFHRKSKPNVHRLSAAFAADDVEAAAQFAHDEFFSECRTPHHPLPLSRCASTAACCSTTSNSLLYSHVCVYCACLDILRRPQMK